MKTVDERIVQMQFDNGQFERGIKTSLDSIGALKKGLNFNGAINSMSELDKAGRAFSLSGMSETIDHLANKFTILGIAGITAIQNITNSAINSGKQLLKSFTIDPIKEGYKEYEGTIKASRTMMSGTGETLEVVNAALKRLNKYSDDTIYSFGDMTSNISKFTNAGLKSKDAANAIIGISNAAALAGASADDAGRAMYQLGQAMSGGYVQLMDWKSVENANMSTVNFRQSLIDAAVAAGTLSKTTDGMYTTIQGTPISAMKGFNLSLQDQWMTTDVLSKVLRDYGDETTAVGKKAFSAAKDVTSGTQLLDIMRESLAGAWTESWNTIIGDADQAKALWTSVSKAIDPIISHSGKVRNELLSEWSKLGGRAVLISGLANAFKGLMSVLRPIGEAFKEVFPTITVNRLATLTANFKNFMATFKIGAQTSENLKNTFKGLFALLDIGRRTAIALAKGFFTLVKFMLPVGDAFLGYTGSIGEFISHLNEALKSSTVFSSVLKLLGSVVTPIALGVRKAIIALIEGITSFSSIDYGSLDLFTEKLGKSFKPLTSLANLAKNIGDIFYKLAGFIGKVFDTLRTVILGFFGSVNFNAIADAINSGLFAALLLSLKKFVDGLSGVTGSVKGMFRGVSGILDDVGNSLKALQSSLKADTLFKISIAIGVLAAALFVLSKIDPKKLASSLGAMTGMFLELLGAMTVFDVVMGKSGFIGLVITTTTMIGLSVALLILSAAMEKLGKLDWAGVGKGLAGLAGMMALLVLASQKLAANTPMLISSAVGLILFTVVINQLVKAVEKLGKLDTKFLVNGLIGVGVLLTGLVLFMKKTDQSKMGIASGVGLLIFAGAVLVLTTAVKKLSLIDPGALLKGLAGIAVILAQIVGFTEVMDSGKGLISTAVGLTVLGGALLLIAKSVTILAKLSWEQMSRGLLTMAGALAAITIAFNMLPKSMFLKSIAIVDVAGALVVLSGALKTMAKLSWEEIAKSLVTLGVSLGLITTMFKILKESDLVDSTAFLIMTVGITLLTQALKTLGDLSLVQLATGLGALVAVFALIGGATILLTPLIVPMLGLSAALLVFGLAVAAIGGGVLMLSTGLTALAVAGTAVSVTFIAMVSGLVGLIPFVFKQLAQGIIEFVTGLANSSTAIANAIVVILQAVIKTLDGVIPYLVKVVAKLLISLLTTIDKIMPKLIDLGMKIVISFLKGISDNIEKLVIVGVTLIVNFINGLSSMLPKLIEAAFGLMIAFINGLAVAIEKNAPLVISAIQKLALSIPKAILKIMANNITGFVGAGKNLVLGFIKGIKSMIVAAANAASDLGSSVLNSAKAVLGIRSPSTEGYGIGGMFDKGVANGIEKGTKEIVNAAENMSKEALNASSGVVTSSNKVAKTASTASNAAAKSAFDSAVEWIDERKYYNELSLDQELAKWQEVQAKYKEGTEERKKLDREVYRVKKEQVAAAYANSMRWIEEEKFYGRLKLNDELAAYKRVQAQYAEGSANRIQADRDVYRIEREINNANKEYAQNVIDIAESANNRRIELQKEYYDNTKAINDRLADDIQRVNDEYDNAVKSRADSLYKSYGLFDKVEKQQAVSGKQLIRNLQSQNAAFADWESQLDGLSAKGVSAALIEELREMGPGSLAQIKALNKLSSPELDTYVSLWQTKHSEAKSQAVEELDGMRIETLDKIDKLNDAAETELFEYRKTWWTAMETLSANTAKQLTTLTTNWLAQIGGAKTESEVQLLKLTENIQTIMKQPDWVGLGANVVDGMIVGIESRVNTLATVAAAMAITAFKSAKDALEEKSPSKKFRELGQYAVDGFVIGLKNVSTVVESSKNLGKTAINSLSAAIANTAEAVSGDLNLSPTIRPVLDLSNVNAGKKSLNGMFGSAGINVSSTNQRVSALTKDLKSGSPLDAVTSLLVDLAKNQTDQNGSVSFEGLFKDATFVIRDETDIDKVATKVSQKLYSRAQGVSRGRGLVAT